MIDITGYITEADGNNEFTIKVTSDKVQQLPLNDIQVSKEVTVFINPYRYPSDYYVEFEKITGENNYRRDRVNNCLSLSKVLKRGDQVKCSVFIVESETRNGDTTHNINNNRKDVETYADFPLWLYPNADYFKRLEVDSKKSLKFRKQWLYTCINRQKYEKITGDTLYGYRDKGWIRKRPNIVSPILWWIRFRTAVSKLRKGFTKQENLTKISIIISIILALITIWSLFFKNANPSP